MVDGVKTLLDHAFPESSSGHMLILPENHTMEGTHVFTAAYAKEMEMRGVTTQFLETPYWLNPVLEAYHNNVIEEAELKMQIYENVNAPYITDEMRDAFAAKIVAGKEAGIMSIGVDVRSSEALFWDDKVMAIFAERDPDSLTGKQRSQLQAWQLKQQFPDTVKYRGVAQYLSGRGVPEDSVHAVLADLHLQDRGGNALLTYGARHMKGAIEQDVQGIIDDALEERGVKATTAFVANTTRDMIRMDQFRKDLADRDIAEGKKFISDKTDFRLNLETGVLETPADIITREGRLSYYEPYANGLSLSDVFRDTQVKPNLLPNFDRIVNRARLNGIDTLGKHPTYVDGAGNTLEPFYKVELNKNGRFFYEIKDDHAPEFLSRKELVQFPEYVTGFNTQPYYDVSQSMSTAYLQTVPHQADGEGFFISGSEAANQAPLIMPKGVETQALEV